MENQPLVSIIIPVYNVEKYIDRCVNSVVNQSYRNIEIILVDDGSLDCCPNICDAWSLKDKRIKVIHKENAGLGMARNAGLDIIKGEFVFFIDSDDYVADNMVEKTVKVAIEEGVDVVCFGFSSIGVNGKIKNSQIPKTKKKTFRGDEISVEFLADLIAPNSKTGESTNLLMSAWATMISSGIIQKYDWRFVSEREYISEDVYSLLKLYKYINSVAIVSEPFYFYCENTDSLTQTYNPKRFERIIKFYRDVINLCNDLEYCNEVKDRLDYLLMSNTIGTLKVLCKSNLSGREKFIQLKFIIDNPVLQGMLKRPQIYKAESIARRIIIYLIKRRCYSLCFLLIWLRNKHD